MNAEEKQAVKELLEKIPKSELDNVVGGLSKTARNLLIGAGLIVGSLAAVAFLRGSDEIGDDDPETKRKRKELLESAEINKTRLLRMKKLGEPQMAIFKDPNKPMDARITAFLRYLQLTGDGQQITAFNTGNNEDIKNYLLNRDKIGWD